LPEAVRQPYAHLPNFAFGSATATPDCMRIFAVSLEEKLLDWSCVTLKPRNPGRHLQVSILRRLSALDGKRYLGRAGLAND
jgi:hypothetical protein